MLTFKKARADMMGYILFLGLYIVVLAFSSVFILSTCYYTVERAANIPEDVEDELVLIPRFYNSENCFAYKDDIGRVHTRVIDMEKFKQENIDKCFPESNVKYDFSLSLEVPELALNVDPVNTSYWEDDLLVKKIVEDVFVLYDDARYDAKLKVSIKNGQ
jgi:hypothetical protein|tara:strand:- start:1086 stop:1565 length:480 start_codon:yes stop_codon:yes gene_type:complete